MRQLESSGVSTNLALIFADCCRENKINSQIEAGIQTNCSFYPTEPLYSTQKPLGQPLPIEFNNITGKGIQLEKYFQDKLNAKGKPWGDYILIEMSQFFIQNQSDQSEKFVGQQERK